MSWFIEVAGKREAVRAHVAAQQLPDAIKAAVLSVLGDEPEAPTGVRIHGFGHTYTGPGSSHSNIAKLEVLTFPLVE